MAVSAPWAFKLADGEEGTEQIAVEDEIYNEIKDDNVEEEESRRKRNTRLSAENH